MVSKSLIYIARSICDVISTRLVIDMCYLSVDHVTIPSKLGKGNLKRVSEVFDCWFESGSMPYAQKHYPFEVRLPTFKVIFSKIPSSSS